MNTAKNKIFYYKPPDWLRQRKHAETSQNYFKPEAINKFEVTEQDFHTTAGTNADIY